MEEQTPTQPTPETLSPVSNVPTKENPKPVSKMMMYGLGILVLILLGGGAYAAYNSMNARPTSEVTPIVTTTMPTASLSPTLAPTMTVEPTKAATTTGNMKTYSDDDVGFQYPSNWLASAQTYAWGKSITVEDKKDSRTNSLSINIEVEDKTGRATGVSTDDGWYEMLVSYEINSTAAYGDMNPQEVSHEDGIFGGKKGRKYLHSVTPNETFTFSKVTSIFLATRPIPMYVIYHGKDETTLDKIAASIKFKK